MIPALPIVPAPALVVIPVYVTDVVTDKALVSETESGTDVERGLGTESGSGVAVIMDESNGESNGNGDQMDIEGIIVHTPHIGVWPTPTSSSAACESGWSCRHASSASSGEQSRQPSLRLSPRKR